LSLGTPLSTIRSNTETVDAEIRKPPRILLM
jgi:hypothetical protein